jgi:uncharacterized protein (TIGR02147 family)
MNITSYFDYRPFLRHLIHNLPQKGRGQIGKMARHLRIHSSLISQILSGQKDFSLEQANDLSQYLGLSPFETDYFLFLVQHSRAGTKALKNYFANKLKDLQAQSLDIKNRIPEDYKLTAKEYSVFYSSWLYSVVWLFTSVGSGQTIESVSQRFEISRTKASEILHFLVDVGLCVFEKDKYKMGPNQIHLERTSPFLSKHHSNWRVKAIQRCEDLDHEELMFTSPISISKKDFLALREGLVEFIKAAAERIEKSPAEELACLNLDFFFIKK